MMTLMEEQIFHETGIRNEAEIKSKAPTLKELKKPSMQGTDQSPKSHPAAQTTHREVHLWVKNNLDERCS